MASLKDIARELGVSASLVSKVLNNRLGTTGVSPALGEAIRAKAIELGFQRNTSAVALRRGRHDVLGVFIHCLGMAGSGIVDELLGGITSAAMEGRQRLLLNFFGDASQFEQLAASAHRGAMDGLLVGGVTHRELASRLLDIHAGGLPVVTLFERPVHPDLPNVGSDQVEVARLATRHLLECGCRRVAHILNTQDRFTGYAMALAEAGIAQDPAWVFAADARDFSHTTGEQAVTALLSRDVAFDGLFAQSDQEAVGATNALFAAGRRVPEDVRIIGIDNAPYCEFSRVRLSSVSQEFRTRGVAAVNLLLEAVAGRPVQSRDVAPRLVARDSTRR